MPQFQYEAVKAMMEDSKLFPSIQAIVDQNAFESKELRTIVGTIKDYYQKNGYVPDYTSLEIAVLSKTNEPDEAMKAINMVKGASTKGRNAINDMVTRFFKLKHLIATANKILDRVKAGDDDSLIIKQAMGMFEKISADSGDGVVMTKMTNDTFTQAIMENDADNVIPTGIEELDIRLAGGLGRKEIGLFVAPTGYGKTTAGTIFANNAARMGYKVLQIYFEDKPMDIVRKHLACATGGFVNSFKGKTAEKTKEIIESIDDRHYMTDNLILLKMADGQTTVEDIRTRIMSLISEEGFKPDLVIIDYFSSLKHSANPIKDKWEAQAKCMRKIKELSFEFDMAIWVMQQTNRTAVSKDGDSSGMGNLQGSFEATQPVSVWLTLQRTKEQRQNFRADIIFNKTRHSQPKDDLINIKFDNSTLQIDCKDEMVQMDEDLMFNDDYEYTGHFGQDKA